MKKEKDINLLSKEDQIKILEIDAYGIQYINNPCLEIQLAAVSENGFNIRYIKTPGLEVQLTAVNKNGYSICYIKTPYYEVQLAAIQKNIINKEYFEVIKEYITYPDLLELLELKMLACDG